MTSHYTDKNLSY